MSADHPPTLLGGLRATSAAAQASVPGAYAWAVTVAPGAFSQGAPALAGGAAVTALVALCGGIAAERIWGARGQRASFWLFVLLCAVAWSSAPSSLAPAKFDALRGLLAMSGWALYAYASAAPAVSNQPLPAPHTPTRRRQLGDAALLGAALALVVFLQSLGWGSTTVERSILVRVVAVAASLAVIGVTTAVANERHRDGRRASPRARLKRAWSPLLLLALLLVAGVVLEIGR